MFSENFVFDFDSLGLDFSRLEVDYVDDFYNDVIVFEDFVDDDDDDSHLLFI